VKREGKRELEENELNHAHAERKGGKRLLIRDDRRVFIYSRTCTIAREGAGGGKGVKR
jgi:hypothetical protein